MAKALIDTTCLSPIQGQVLFTVRGLGYRVFVQEARASVWPYRVTNPPNPTPQVNNRGIFCSDDEDDSIDQIFEGLERPIQEGDDEIVQDSCNLEEENQEAPGKILNFNEDEHTKDSSIHGSTSRTETTSFFGNTNHHNLVIDTGVMDVETSIVGCTDSEATLGAPKSTQPTTNAIPLSSRKELSVDSNLNDVLENLEESRKSQKSRKKKAKRLREKCRVIQKEINASEEDVLKARHAWEVTKLAGLGTKGDDEDVVQKIARNIALEKLERQKQL